MLESLDLLGIDKIVGECLSRIPEDMPHLKYLDLKQCNQVGVTVNQALFVRSSFLLIFTNTGTCKLEKFI